MTVAERVTAGRGRLAVSRPRLVAVQDRTAGIHVRLPDSLVVERGDSLRVRGVVTHAYGLTRLRSAEGRVVEAGARTPAPLPLTVNTAAGEQHEGRLARVRGRIAGKGTNRGATTCAFRPRGPRRRRRLKCSWRSGTEIGSGWIASQRATRSR